MNLAARHPRRKWKDRQAFARPLVAGVIGLQILHLLAVLFLPHPVFVSNLFQLCFPLLVAAISLHQSLSCQTPAGRRSWYSLVSAFSIWALAQALYLYYLRVPCHFRWPVRPDDVLWLLFGLPLLLCIVITGGKVDRIAWLDRAQPVVFITVLYCLLFLPPHHLATAQAYLIQNLALILCCFLRIPVSCLPRERRFFIRLIVFLITYAVLESLGDFLYAHGFGVGSVVDLVWTLPHTVLILLILHDALRVDRIDARPHRFSKAFRTMQGLSVAGLAFLSVGLTATLARHHPVLGGLFVATSLTLFALRTNLRERLWNEAHEKLKETSLQDPLTGLGNRLHLRRLLEQRLAQRGREPIFLLFVDLDRFKQINDSLGHALGDRVLIEAGRRLSAVAPPASLICRIGSDEFVVLTSVTDIDQASSAGERLLHALHAPLHLGERDLRCTASIGVVQAVEDETADELLRTADHAMHRAKQVGRDRVQVFDAALRADISGHWQMEADLRACIAENSIGVAFQPIYSVEQHVICGFEALARWSHPVLGSVPPVDFITLAERSGLISDLGAQILEKACAQMAAWNRTWGTRLTVSVNVSAHQFADAALMPLVLEVLERTGLPPTLLRLEITETALLINEAVVKQTLEAARELGIRISLDDFGTGYSSLSFLLSLPVDELKVDRSFVSHMIRDPNRKELVRTVVHLGHTLGKRVVAEGVETEGDLLSLTEMGCECVQGYFIGKPLSPEAVEADLPSIGITTLLGQTPPPPLPASLAVA